MTDIEINPTSFVDTIQLTVKDTGGTEDEVRRATGLDSSAVNTLLGIEKIMENDLTDPFYLFFFIVLLHVL